MRLFELLVGDILTDEVFAISLVSEPAIEENFVWFDKEKIQFSKVDNEKRLVVGPVLIPNKKILRIDGEGQPYEVFFSFNSILNFLFIFFIKFLIKRGLFNFVFEI